MSLLTGFKDTGITIGRSNSKRFIKILEIDGLNNRNKPTINGILVLINNKETINKYTEYQHEIYKC